MAGMRQPPKPNLSTPVGSPKPQRSPVRNRLISTAVAHIERHGMSVSLEHLSLERVIAESGISRASAYRHFASKSDFLKEVLTTVLVRSTRLEGESPAQVEDLLSLIADRKDALDSVQGRRDLVVEGLRRAAQADFDRVAISPQWRTYLALHATCRGLPDEGLREEVLAVLADAETQFTAHRAGVYSRLATLLGYRLVPPLVPPSGFEVMADAAGALMTGLVVRALTLPDTAARIIRVAAHGSTEQADWTWPAHHIAGLILAHLEPDPDVAWDHTQRSVAAATLEQMLQALSQMRE